MAEAMKAVMLAMVAGRTTLAEALGCAQIVIPSQYCTISSTASSTEVMPSESRLRPPEYRAPPPTAAPPT